MSKEDNVGKTANDIRTDMSYSEWHSMTFDDCRASCEAHHSYDNIYCVSYRDADGEWVEYWVYADEAEQLSFPALFVTAESAKIALNKYIQRDL